MVIVRRAGHEGRHSRYSNLSTPPAMTPGAGAALLHRQIASARCAGRARARVALCRSGADCAGSKPRRHPRAGRSASRPSAPLPTRASFYLHRRWEAYQREVSRLDTPSTNAGPKHPQAILTTPRGPRSIALSSELRARVVRPGLRPHQTQQRGGSLIAFSSIRRRTKNPPCRLRLDQGRDRPLGESLASEVGRLRRTGQLRSRRCRRDRR